MAKKTDYDISRFRVKQSTQEVFYLLDNGKWELTNGEDDPRFRWWYKNHAKTEKAAQKARDKALKPLKQSRSYKIPNEYKKRFQYSTRKLVDKDKNIFKKGKLNFTNRGGHFESWARPLNNTGGKNPNFNWDRPYYKDFKTKNVSRMSMNARWGSVRNNSKAPFVINGMPEFQRHLEIVFYNLIVNAERFRIAVGQRAIKVFQNSIRNQQFDSAGSTKWHPLSTFTLKKRAKRRTGSHILKEYEDLMYSIKLQEPVYGAYKTTVFTDVVPANSFHHKKHSICYAGLHNEGRHNETYGNGWGKRVPRRYIKRQFMGHSSKLDPYENKFIRDMMTLYLFDNVFTVKKF